MDSEPLPQYMRIALDIASRIASGEIEEHQKISGRSVLSSEYNVSPETIRKAVTLLSDMKVVEVQEKKSAVILSADNARRYVESVSYHQEQQKLRSELKALMEQNVSIGKQVFTTAEKLMNARAIPLPADKCLPNYEVRVSPGSDKIGQSVQSMKFWQSTGATVIAIRRNQNLILSPGPYAEIYEGDVIVFVGNPDSVAAVQYFLNGTSSETALSQNSET